MRELKILQSIYLQHLINDKEPLDLEEEAHKSHDGEKIKIVDSVDGLIWEN